MLKKCKNIGENKQKIGRKYVCRNLVENRSKKGRIFLEIRHKISEKYALNRSEKGKNRLKFI